MEEAVSVPRKQFGLVFWFVFFFSMFLFFSQAFYFSFSEVEVLSVI